MTLPPFVKKFDFRGIYNKDIHDQDAYYLGLALAQTLPLKKVLIGWDTRPSSKNLATNFMKALQEKAIEISYLDQCPIDYITAAANHFDFDLAIMFTGSHNPWNWTGLLMHTKGGNSIQGEMVNKIVAQYWEAQKQPYTPDAFHFETCKNFMEEIETVYGEKITSLIPLTEIKPLTVLVDVGDGSGSRSLTLLEKLLPQVHFSRIHDRRLYDEHSTHIADPSTSENMLDLMNQMKQGNFDCGFAFDSDADRVLAVDREGTYLSGSLVGSAIIDAFIQLGLTDTRFGYAVDCGPSIANTVNHLSQTRENKMSIQPVPVGRSILRQMIRDNKVDLAVENVGHFYTRDFFMTDSATFTLAIILYWITSNGSLSLLKSKHPDGFHDQIFTPAETAGSPTEEAIYKSVHTQDNPNRTEKKIELDGIRYEFFEADQLITWYTIRKSGYEPIVKYYFGSLKEEEFHRLQTILQSLLKNT